MALPVRSPLHDGLRPKAFELEGSSQRFSACLEAFSLAQREVASLSLLLRECDEVVKIINDISRSRRHRLSLSLARLFSSFGSRRLSSIGAGLKCLLAVSGRLTALSAPSKPVIRTWTRELRAAFQNRSFLKEVEAIEHSLESLRETIRAQSNQLESLYVECVDSLMAVVISPTYKVVQSLQGVSKVLRKQSLHTRSWERHVVQASQLRAVGRVRFASGFVPAASAESGKRPEENEPQASSAALSRDVCIVQLTPSQPKNPFFRIYGDALIGQGYDFKYSIDFKEIERIIRAKLPAKTILHLHHLDALYRNRRIFSRNVEESATQLFERLAYFRELGARIVWTFHDLTPHSEVEIELGEACARIMGAFADRVIVLGEYPRRCLANLRNPIRISVVPHPSFAHLYQSLSSDGEGVRTRLGISPDTLVFGSLGTMRPYKRLEALIEGFRRYKHDAGRPKSKLVLFGGSGDPEYVAMLKRAAEGDSDVVISDAFVPDEEVPAIVSSFDWSVFAMQDIWMSSSVSLSLSIGTPVVAPKVGCIPEIVGTNSAGILYDPFDPDGLRAALLEAEDVTLRKRMAINTEHYRQRFDISACVEVLKSVYGEALL